MTTGDEQTRFGGQTDFFRVTNGPVLAGMNFAVTNQPERVYFTVLNKIIRTSNAPACILPALNNEHRSDSQCYFEVLY